jgi:hypothetical protein
MNKKIIFLLIFFLSAGLFLQLPDAFASSFTSASLRLDHQTPNAALSGTVCAQSSSANAGTENKVTITFPSDFTISTNTDNWTTDTNNLPSGATVWPSIGAAASSVSGQSVTFSSDDLTSDALYCFNFVGTSSTTGSTGNDKTGVITSKNSSNTTIDSATYAVSILSNNQIGISATVPPTVSYLPISIESTTTGDNFPQNTILNYKITYGSLTTVAFPLTIQAQWSQGTIAGSPVPSVDIVDYVIGSASDGYGSTPAIVDTVNNTITWTIPSFPGNTLNKTVTFSLKTNNSYTGFSSVSFDVLARAISGSTVTPDKTVTKKYLYNASLEPTSTPTPTPTSNATSGNTTTTTSVTATPTPSPTTTAKAPSFSAITVGSLSQSQASIVINTDSNSTYTLKYGTTPTSLSQNIISLTSLTENSITLPDLVPDTNYYFKVIAKDATGKVTNSDTFIFKTAAVSKAPIIDPQSLLVTSNNNVLVNPASAGEASGKQPNGNSSIAVPESSTFDIQFSLKKSVSVKSIQAIVRKKVLGASTFFVQEAEASTNYATLVEVNPGVYSGRLKTLPAPGSYEIYIRIIDYNGNIIEQKLADLTVTPKLTVYDKTSKKGIENASALLSLYNEGTRIYDIISPDLLPIANPIFSQPSGEYDIVLPYGKYRAGISAIGYENQTIEFAIGPNGGYPAIYLTPNSSILSLPQYYLSTLSDAIISSQIYLQQLAKSSRLFDLSTVGAVIFLIGITILSISARTHIAILYLPYFLYFRLSLLLKKGKTRIIFGKVIDEKTKAPISRAKVYLSTPTGNHVLVSLTTNKLGEFYYNNPKGLDYKITVMKEGYSSHEPWEFVNAKIKAIPVIFEMKMQGKPHRPVLEIILLYIEDFLGMCMEALVIFGTLVLIYFVFTFGLLKTAPLICITIANLALILTYLYRPRRLYD